MHATLDSSYGAAEEEEAHLTIAYLNRIATQAAAHDVHDAFVRFAEGSLSDGHERALFRRVVKSAGIERRYSVLAPAPNASGPSVDADAIYSRGSFPSTAERMKLFEQHAPSLAVATVELLEPSAEERLRITHVIAVSCTGMYAPGLDLDLVIRLGLEPTVERTSVTFMGCQASVNALRLARHIVRSEPASRVLVVSTELCSLHLQESTVLEKMLSFLLFGDGCAAALVSADPAGISLDSFHSELLLGTMDLITWRVRDMGCDMFLSGRVPGVVARALGPATDDILDGATTADIAHWAVHPASRIILDGAEQGLELPNGTLAVSRDVLSRYGNMSSATLLFVLHEIMKIAQAGERGCALTFGPGLTAETFLFHKV